MPVAALWVAAAAPLLVLLLLLIGLRWRTTVAAPIGLLVGIAGAVLVFGLPVSGVAVATGKGVWDAIFILYIVWPALLLYNVSDAAGAFLVVRRDIDEIVPSPLLQVLAIGWVLASFIQGAAGFGTPIAVAAPLLFGLGVQPIFAAVIPLIGNAWANMFGSLGVSWFVIVRGVQLIDPFQTALCTAGLLLIPDLAAGLAICWLYGRMGGVAHGWPAVGAVVIAHGIVLLALVTVVPSVAMFLAAMAGLGALFAVAWSPLYPHRQQAPRSPIIQPARGTRSAPTPKVSIHTAFLPYYALIALILPANLIPPLATFLRQVQVGLPFPATSSLFGESQAATTSYAPIAPLAHPGTFLLLATLIGYLVFKRRGLYQQKSMWNILSKTANDALPATTAIAAFLVLAAVMDHSGQITFIGQRLSALGNATLLLILSPVLGLLGSLITSSTTASNILFAPLQSSAAANLDVAQPLVIAGQATGAAVGNAASPSDALVGAATVEIVASLGLILRYTLPWALATLIPVAGALLLLSFLVVL